MKKIISAIIAIFMIVSLAACAEEKKENEYVVGICNYVDDASLNQIVASIQNRLDVLGERDGVTFTVKYDNCNADANVLSQIISNFESQNVDIMVGVATPVAMAMQSATEDSKTPVIFSAVSDPLGVGLVGDPSTPGGNISGTSDYLDTEALLNVLFAVKPDAKKIGLLYDVGQDSSKKPIEEAKKYLQNKGVEVVEHTGTTVDEITLAAQAMVTDRVDAVFTPTDNTVMKSELAIYEILANAGIPHFAGADSFALNGAFMGYGVDYVEIGTMTADMVHDVLVKGKKVGELAVEQPANGTATVNTEIAEKLGFDLEELKTAITPYCTQIKTLTTAEDFGN